jgi:hypothetical protein
MAKNQPMLNIEHPEKSSLSMKKIAFTGIREENLVWQSCHTVN